MKLLLAFKVIGSIVVIAVVAYLIYKYAFEHMTLPSVDQLDQPSGVQEADLVKKGIESEYDFTEKATSIPAPLNGIEQSYPAVYKSSKIDIGNVYDNPGYTIGEPSSPTGFSD